jgi:hypothetical protein
MSLNVISGHAPCEPRQAFLDSIEAGEPDLKLAGNLWKCTDILPGTYCDDLGIPHDSTYAQAARFLKQNQITLPRPLRVRGAEVGK